MASLKSKKVKHFRHYNLSTRRQLAQFDLCLIKPADSSYKGFVILVDCYTRFTWYSLIKSKKKSEVLSALEKITKKTGQFQNSSSDLELQYTKTLWQEKGTFYHSLSKGKHAVFAEVNLMIIKSLKC